MSPAVVLLSKQFATVVDAMRPGAYLVNTSRAEVLDHAAVERAVRERGVRVGLDVFEGEPTSATERPTRRCPRAPRW